MPTTGDIIEFLKPIAGTDKIDADTDIFKELGMVGDDFHEIIEKFTATYGVDMTPYRWYFHAEEEGAGWSIGGLFFKPPYRRVKRIR